MVTRWDSDIISRITTLDFEPRQCDLFACHQEGTCQWFLRSDEFQGWVANPKQTLFCPGDSGAGKTILTSVAIEYLLSRFKDDESVGIAYIYYDHRDQNLRNNKDLLASLLKQLSRRRTRVPESVRLLYTGQSSDNPSLLELSRALSSVVSLFKQVYIVFDAIDEFKGYHDSPATFLGKLLGLQSEQAANLMVTSREVGDAVSFFGSDDNVSTVRVSATEADLQRYLDARAFRLPTSIRTRPELEEKIKKAIATSAEGRFLLAQLLIHSFIEGTSSDTIEAAFARLSAGPDVYSNAYENVMNRISSQGADQEALAGKALAWLTYAKRPLTPAELETALAVQTGSTSFDSNNLPAIDSIVSSCAGLVAVDKTSDIVQLIHPTANEYFERTLDQWFPSTEDVPAATCISYLSLDTFNTGMCATKEQFQDRTRQYPFYRYAARHWGHHVRQSMDADKAAIAFLQDPPRVQACRQFMEKYGGGRFPSQKPAMHLAAYFGLKEAADALVKNGYDIDLRDSDGRTPLSWAAEKGHNDTVGALLLTGRVEVNSEAKWMTRTPPSYARGDAHRTPLSFAAKNGHQTVARMLIDSGADLDRKNDDGSTITWADAKVEGDIDHMDEDGDFIEGAGYVKRPWDRSPLSFAAANGHDSTVKLLLERGAVVQDETSPKWKPLFYAAKKGRAAIIDILIQHGASYEATDGAGFTPLLVAILHEQKAAAEMLLRKGASVNTPNAQSGERPLSLAARTSNEHMVSFLLENGADVRLSEMRAVHNPLSHAAERGNLAIVNLLLSHGADAAAKGDDLHDGPLSLAARKGHKDISDLLAEAIFKTSNESAADLLLVAAQLDQLEVVQYLLSRGEDIETSNGESGRTILSWAAGNGCERVVKYLVDNGADIETMDHEGQTPFWWASRMQRVSVIRYLRLHGAVFDYQDWQHSLFYLAVADGHVDIFKYFLEEDPDSNISANVDRIGRFGLETRNSAGRTPLLRATANGNDALVECILSKNPNIEAKDTDGYTALTLAARGGHLKVVQSLLASKADPNAVDHKGWTAVWHAVEQRKTECALLLLEPMHHFRWTDNEQKTLLGHAAWAHNYEVVGRLIQRGANINQLEDGKPLLAWACEQKRFNVVKLLCHFDANPDRVGVDGKPPLCYAAEKGQWAAADALLTHGAQIDHADSEGRTPLAWAAWNGYKQIVTLLLHRGANANNGDRAGRTPLWYATWREDKDVENLLRRAENGGGGF